MTRKCLQCGWIWECDHWGRLLLIDWRNWPYELSTDSCPDCGGKLGEVEEKKS